MTQPRLEFVFGGTFDPVHFGHLAIIQCLQELAPDCLIRIMPCAIPVIKKLPSSQFRQRLDMLRLALQDSDAIVLDPREGLRNKPSYTLESIISLQADFPHTRFAKVIGADTALGIQDWYQWQQLASHCHFVLLNRPGASIERAEQSLSEAGFKPASQLNALGDEPCGQFFSLNMAEMPQSSSKIRQAVANHQALDSMLPQSVIEYIKTNGLYL